METTYRRGFRRSDGYIFWSYKRLPDGDRIPVFLNPESYARQQANVAKWRVKNRKRSLELKNNWRKKNQSKATEYMRLYRERKKAEAEAAEAYFKDNPFAPRQ